MPAAAEYRSRRPQRLAAFALASVVTVLMIAWVAVQVLDAMGTTRDRSVTSYAGVAVVDLSTGHGEVDLVRAEGERVTVELDVRNGPFGDPDHSAELSRGRLRLEGGCPVVSLVTCAQRYTIAVPEGTAVKVRTTAGRIEAAGVRGDLDLESRAGLVAARRVRSDSVRLRSAAGAVVLESAVADDVEVGTAAGSVQVSLLRPPRRVDASSSAGQVVLRLPDVAYDVDAETSFGEQHVRVRNRPGAPRTVRVRSGAGEVLVLPLARAVAPSSPSRSRSGTR